MYTIITAICWAVALIAIPALLLDRALETPEQRIARLSRSGMSQRAIAAQLGCTRHQVRRALALQVVAA